MTMTDTLTTIPRPSQAKEWTPEPAEIHALAREIASKFRPDRVVLFGSYAYGAPTPDSDVDMLVIMETANWIEAAVSIYLATTHPFPLDLIVRTPVQFEAGSRSGDTFTRDILEHGVVLYDRRSTEMGSQSRS